MKISLEPRFFHADERTNKVSSRIKPFPIHAKTKSFDAEYQTSLAAGKVNFIAMQVLALSQI